MFLYEPMSQSKLVTRRVNEGSRCWSSLFTLWLTINEMVKEISVVTADNCLGQDDQ